MKEPERLLKTVDFIRGEWVAAIAPRVILGEAGRQPRSALTTRFMKEAEQLGVNLGIRDPKVVIYPTVGHPDLPVRVEIRPWVVGRRLEIFEEEDA